jgi:hypothetical protein
MSSPMKDHITVRCSCGRVELELIGAPISSVACYCDDCQEGARRIEALPAAPPILDADGGSELVLYRKDRMSCTKGADLLRDHRLEEDSPTRRVVASCCNSAMFLDFQKGHWYSMYRGRLEGDVPPVQMRVQTKFRPRNTLDPGDGRSFAGFPPRFLFKLLSARVAMLFG